MSGVNILPACYGFLLIANMCLVTTVLEAFRRFTAAASEQQTAYFMDPRTLKHNEKAGNLGVHKRMIRFSAPVQTGPGAHPASCTMGNGSLPGGKERMGCDTDPSPPSSAAGHERVELYLYSHCRPYGLYRASVPVQG